ncbi:TIGR03745 family integrating conjugative element membrane protein [Alloalcanivorax xenomutans]|jgi:integrating conjugative element membrane protein (TIGR03745 family)|uniref:TIGR03745 family integrating conjugative element membrane protein n=1 Tax=Alloalcanivorax xenomutans TaxID=1094342 RepID=UPI000E257406
MDKPTSTLFRSHLSARIRRLGQALWVMLMSACLPALAHADLPQMEDPSRGQGSGIMETLQNHGYDIGILAGLAISTIAFLVVGGAAIAQFNEARKRGEWGTFGVVCGVGAIMLVIIIWLMTEAATIL